MFFFPLSNKEEPNLNQELTLVFSLGTPTIRRRTIYNLNIKKFMVSKDIVIREKHFPFLWRPNSKPTFPTFFIQLTIHLILILHLRHKITTPMTTLIHLLHLILNLIRRIVTTHQLFPILLYTLHLTWQPYLQRVTTHQPFPTSLNSLHHLFLVYTGPQRDRWTLKTETVT